MLVLVGVAALLLAETPPPAPDRFVGRLDKLDGVQTVDWSKFEEHAAAVSEQMKGKRAKAGISNEGGDAVDWSKFKFEL